MPRYTEDQNGYITFNDNPISKSGVFPYLGSSIDPDGSKGLDPDTVYNVYRPESELNNPETIESFKLSPWIPGHEMLGTDFTPAEDVGVQGVTGERVYFKNGTLYSNLRMFGDSLKAAIRAGLKELSCGFRCAWDIVSGVTPDGVHYDVIQREIRGNHLASVPEGRMGSDVSVAMDRAVFALDNLDIELKPDGGTMTLEEMMAKIKEAQPAKQELEKFLAEATALLNGGSSEEVETEVEVSDMEEVDVKAEDYEEVEAKAEDKEEVDAKASVMDEQIKSLQSQVKKLTAMAMDSKSVEKKINAKNDLVNKISKLGVHIDSVGMDESDVAKEAVKKLGIACDSGEELAILKGYLAHNRTEQTTADRGFAQDAAASEIPESLKGIF